MDNNNVDLILADLEDLKLETLEVILEIASRETLPKTVFHLHSIIENNMRPMLELRKKCLSCIKDIYATGAIAEKTFAEILRKSGLTTANPTFDNPEGTPCYVPNWLSGRKEGR